MAADDSLPKTAFVVPRPLSRREVADLVRQGHELTRDPKARERFGEMIRRSMKVEVLCEALLARVWKAENRERAKRGLPAQEWDEAKLAEVHPELVGPGPFHFKGPERSLADRYAILAAVHDHYIDAIRRRAGGYVAVLNPWVGESPVPHADEPESEVDRLTYFRRVVERCGGARQARTSVRMAERYLLLVHDVKGVTDEDQQMIRDCIAAVRADLELTAGQADDLAEAVAGKGVKPRRQWFLQQYEAVGQNTYHKPAVIHAKWSAMKPTERAAICPDSPNKIAKETVASDIKRLLRERDATRTARPKGKARKKA